MIIAALIAINILLWYTNRKEPVLEEVKERYRTLREHLKKTDEPKFRMLHDEIPIVAYKGSLMRGVGGCQGHLADCILYFFQMKIFGFC